MNATFLQSHLQRRHTSFTSSKSASVPVAPPAGDDNKAFILGMQEQIGKIAEMVQSQKQEKPNTNNQKVGLEMSNVGVPQILK